MKCIFGLFIVLNVSATKVAPSGEYIGGGDLEVAPRAVPHNDEILELEAIGQVVDHRSNFYQSEEERTERNHDNYRMIVFRAVAGMVIVFIVIAVSVKLLT